MIDGHDRIYFSDDAQTLSTAAAIGFIIRFCIGGGGQEFPTAVLAAEVGCLSIAFGVESGGGIDGHAADGIDCFGFGCVHVGFSILFVLIALSISRKSERFNRMSRPSCWSWHPIDPNAE